MRTFPVYLLLAIVAIAVMAVVLFFATSGSKIALAAVMVVAVKLPTMALHADTERRLERICGGYR